MKKRGNLFLDIVGNGGIIDVKPMMNVTPLIPIMPMQSNVLPDASDRRKSSCDYKKRRRYKERHEELLTPKMESYLRSNKTTVLHGGRSLNYIFNAKPSDELFRESLDWDIMSRNPHTTSMRIEKMIDTIAKCDIAQTKHVPIPKTFGVEDPTMSSELYRIETPDISGDPEVDVMSVPSRLSTMRHRQITHESLRSQYEKTLKGQLKPMRSFKSGVDRRRIERYWASRGKRPPEDTNRFGLMRL